MDGGQTGVLPTLEELDEERRIRTELACAYRLVDHFGWTELIYGHLTMRLPGPEHHFLINPYGLNYDEVTASNLVRIDLDGNVVDGEHEANFAGFVIHSAIHMAGGDNNCVMHTHTRAGMAVAALEDGLLPISMTATTFFGDIAYHDYEGVSVYLDEREPAAGGARREEGDDPAQSRPADRRAHGAGSVLAALPAGAGLPGADRCGGGRPAARALRRHRRAVRARHQRLCRAREQRRHGRARIRGADAQDGPDRPQLPRLMRAVVCRAFGPPEELEVGTLPAPEPGAGEVAIRVEAAGVSFADTLMIRDLHQNKHALPFAPGMEVAGRVAALGPDVEGLAPGERVMALVYDGGYAERAVAPAAETFPLPDALGVAEASRARRGLSDRPCRPFLGGPAATGRDAAGAGRGRRRRAGGGRGRAGARRARHRRRLERGEARARARARGRSRHRRAGRAGSRRRHGGDRGGAGADAVFDPVGGELFEESFRALGWGGRHIVVGFAGGAIPAFPANHLLVKNRSALGLALFNYRKRRPDRLRASAEALFAWAAEGRLRPHISAELPLEDAPRALRAIMDRQAAGRLVLRI